MRKGVIFDLDGTLTDTIASLKKSANLAIEKFGFGPYTEEDYKLFVGDGAKVLIERCLKAGGDENLEYFDRAYEEYKKVFETYCMYQVKPYDGIVELLKSLKERGIKIAVLSNKPHPRTVEVIHTIFGEHYFDYIQGQCEQLERKPSPEGVFHILKQLNLTPEEILYLGDTGTDMQTGKAAGAFTVGALWGFRSEKELVQNNADAIIKNPLQLLDYL